MDRDHSNGASGSSELTTVPPAGEYYLPDHKDTSKFESNNSNQSFANKKPTKLASYQDIMESDHSNDSDSSNDSDYSNDSDDSNGSEYSNDASIASEPEGETPARKCCLYDPNCLASYRAVIEGDHSNDASRASEPVGKIPAQEYSLPHQEVTYKPGSRIPNQGFAVGEPIPASPVQIYVLLDYELSNQRFAGRATTSELTTQDYDLFNYGERSNLEPRVPNQEIVRSVQTPGLPASAHLSLRGQEDQESSVATVAPGGAVLYPQIPASRAVNVRSQEYPYTYHSESNGQWSEHPWCEKFSRHGSSQSSSIPTSNSSARGSSSVDSQRRALSKAGNPTGAISPHRGQDPRQSAPSTIFRTLYQERVGSPPSKMTPVPPFGVPWPLSIQDLHLPSIREPSKPSTSKWFDYAQDNPLSSHPVCLLPYAFASGPLDHHRSLLLGRKLTR